jgi:hypothetical protein
MSETVETVRVTCPITEGNTQGFYLINKSDFDADVHELFEGDVPAVEEVQPVDHAVIAAEAEADAKQNLEGAVVKPSWQS